MIKKVVKYQDFNGNEMEETFYFNLTKAELTKMELKTKGGMNNYLKEVVESGDTEALIDIFNNMILDSYGIKSEDGKRFIKSEQLKQEFEQSAAFSELFMDIVKNPETAEAFFKGVTNQQ